MANEKRLPRDRFTRKLERICARLTEAPQQTIQFTDRFLREQRCGEVRVRSLWVAGSYARGALTCGDLDLVLDVERLSGSMPATAALNRAFLGSLPRVRAYLGNPEANTSGIEFSEARLLWQADKDWQANLAAMLPDPTAERFVRDYDSLPLNREHLRIDVDTASHLVELEKAGHIQWRFTPLSDITPEPIPPYELPRTQDELSHAIGRHLIFSSKAAAKAAPYLLAYLRQDKTVALRSQRYSNTADYGFAYRGAHVLLAPRGFSVEKLDTFECSRLIVFPALSSRWANGIWEISRGPNHPLTKLFAEQVAWLPYSAEEDVFDSAIYGYSAAVCLDLCRTKETAQEYCDLSAEASANDEEGWPLATPRQVRGPELLTLLSQGDLVWVGPGIPLTRYGAHTLEQHFDSPLAAAEQIVAHISASEAPHD